MVLVVNGYKFLNGIHHLVNNSGSVCLDEKEPSCIAACFISSGERLSHPNHEGFQNVYGDLSVKCLLPNRINWIFCWTCKPAPGVTMNIAVRNIPPSASPSSSWSQFPNTGLLNGTVLMIAVEFNLASTEVHFTPKLI